MTSIFAKISAVTVLSLGIATPVLAGDPAIKARKSLMQLYKFNLAQLGGMAKGKIAYDSKVAAIAANNLKTLATVDQAAMWPAGTDNDAMAGETRALPAIWATYPEVEQKAAALTKATEAMAEAAGTDLASLQGAMGALGASCGGCHKKFRAPKK